MLEDNYSSSQDIAATLRETMLQDSYRLADEEEFLVAEIAAHLCIELAYGDPSPWRDSGYGSLWNLWQTPLGKKTLRNLGRTGNLMNDLVKRAFNS